VLQTSQAIQKFFEDHEHHEGFWDFVHERGLYDAQRYSDRHSYDAFEDGLALGLMASGKEIFMHSTKNLDLYFVGPEAQILAKLNQKLEQWPH